jgi:ribosomal protein L16/L10AE
MSTGRINSKHIETMFRYITKSIKKKTGYIKKNIILNKTLTKKATGIRMGKGKGEIKDIVCSLNKGDHMFEINMFKKQLTNIRPFISACKRSATLARIIHNYKLQTIRLNSFIQYT